MLQGLWASCGVCFPAFCKQCEGAEARKAQGARRRFAGAPFTYAGGAGRGADQRLARWRDSKAPDAERRRQDDVDSVLQVPQAEPMCRPAAVSESWASLPGLRMLQSVVLPVRVRLDVAVDQPFQPSARLGFTAGQGAFRPAPSGPPAG
jgi:hypothetical protein